MLPDRLDTYENIKLLPCPMCGGMPMMLVMHQCFECTVRIECTSCGVSSAGVIFANRRLSIAPEGRRDLLPDLATARRQVVRAWNERECGGEQG